MEYKGNFCVQCGTPAKQAVTVKTSNALKKGGDKTTSQDIWNKVFGYVTSGLAIMAALFALIFVFLIGFGAEIEATSSISTEMINGGKSISIYYFFGDVYKDLEEAVEGLKGLECEGMLTAYEYIYAILGTIIAAATILCSVIFFIPATVNTVRYLMKKSEKTGEKWAIASLLSFVCGCFLLFSMSYVYVEGDVSGVEIVGRTQFSKATVAGLVLVCVFGMLWFVAKLISHGKKWKDVETRKKNIGIICGVLFGIAGLILATYVHFSYKLDIESNVIGVGMSPTTGVYILSMLEEMAGDDVIKYANHLNSVFVSGIIWQFVSLGAIVFGIIALAETALSTGEESKSALFWNILFSVLNAVGLAMCIVLFMNAQAITSDAVGEKTMVYNLAMPILVLVFSAISLAASSVRQAFKTKKEKIEE